MRPSICTIIIIASSIIGILLINLCVQYFRLRRLERACRQWDERNREAEAWKKRLEKVRAEEQLPQQTEAETDTSTKTKENEL